MSGELKAKDGTLLKRVPVIVRSWDGPNSRVGLEMDLSQMPWGPFDALGKRLSLLLPVSEESTGPRSHPDSQVEQALRHVEHAADRCGEFAQVANGNQELWLRSQETWEWIRKYLTALWVEVEVDGQDPPTFPQPAPEPEAPDPVPPPASVPALPGAAATLRFAARALKATPLAVWRESMEPVDPDSPTREEAVQTLLGVARILSSQTADGTAPPSEEGQFAQAVAAEAAEAEPEPSPSPNEDPDQVSFDFAQGYDEGYQMGRRVGLALGAKRKK